MVQCDSFGQWPPSPAARGSVGRTASAVTALSRLSRCGLRASQGDARENSALGTETVPVSARQLHCAATSSAEPRLPGSMAGSRVQTDQGMRVAGRLVGTCWLEVSAVLEGANLWVENCAATAEHGQELCQGGRCSGPHVPSSPVALCHLT